jgi:hypothetical protein
MKKRTDNTPARRAWEKHNNKKLDPGMHVHHLDGNYLNNDPGNLIALTAREHFEIHLYQGDYAACIKLAKCANIDPIELYDIQKQHGSKCVNKKIGIHSDSFNHSSLSKKIWATTPPGRKPVTNGVEVFKFKTDEDVDEFLKKNDDWRRGLPSNYKKGLSNSKRRLTSQESLELSIKRLKDGTHNFVQDYTCPYCGKIGKGPMMKRWHFNNCKKYQG